MGTIDVHRAHFSPEMKSHGVGIEHLLEGSGQNVLTGVLLHVIEAARPINHPCDHIRTLWQSLLKHVHDSAILLSHHDVDHRNPTQHPSIGRLTARVGIEGGAVENSSRMTFPG
jgi:hypothetical protein